MTAFIKGSGNWTDYRSQLGLKPDDEVDLHCGKRDRSVSYDDAMNGVTDIVRNALCEEQTRGRPYVMFIHGWSTSMGWKTTTARSQVRSFMQSKEATALIDRARCIQHETVFIAKVRNV
jgi:hypothetical protein